MTSAMAASLATKDHNSLCSTNLVSAYQHPINYCHHSRKGVSVRMHLRTILASHKCGTLVMYHSLSL